MTLRKYKHSPGFTIFELVIVLFIISVTAAILMPRVGAGWKRMEDRDFIQEFMGTLRGGRLRAMNTGEVIPFRINGAERIYGYESPPNRPIPDNVDMFADHLQEDPETGEKLVVFFPDGSMTGNDIEILFDKQRAFRIFIHPITGSMQVSRVENR